MGSLAALRLPRRLLLATTCSRWHARRILPCSIACSFPTSRWRRGSRRARPDAPSPQPGDRGFESCSLQQTVSLSPAAAFQGREPRFSARVWAAGSATGSAETRQALHCAPTGGNISVGPYSSTAVPLRWLAKMPRRSRQSWVYSALKVRGSLKFGLGSSKAEHGPLIVPGKRKT
jgi:hypothetical protein